MKTLVLFLLLQSGMAWAGALVNCTHIAGALAERQPLYDLMLGPEGFLLSTAFRRMLLLHVFPIDNADFITSDRHEKFLSVPDAAAESVYVRMRELFDEALLRAGNAERIGEIRNTIGITDEQYVLLARAMTQTARDGHGERDLKRMLKAVLPGSMQIARGERGQAFGKEKTTEYQRSPFHLGITAFMSAASLFTKLTNNDAGTQASGYILLAGTLMVPAAMRGVGAFASWWTRRLGMLRLHSDLKNLERLRAEIAHTTRALAPPPPAAAIDPTDPHLIGATQARATIDFAAEINAMMSDIGSSQSPKAFSAALTRASSPKDKRPVSAITAELLPAMQNRIEELQLTRARLDEARRKARALEVSIDGEISRATALRAGELEQHDLTEQPAREEIEIRIDRLSERLGALDELRSSVGKIRQVVDIAEERSSEATSHLQSAMTSMLGQPTGAEFRASVDALAKAMQTETGR